MKNRNLIIFILFILLMTIYCFIVEPNKLEITRYVIRDSELGGIKVVFASDFHIRPYQQKRLEKIVETINAENADIVVSAGDYVAGHTSEATMSIQDIATGLSKVKSKYGFYTVLGNHDGWYDAEWVAENLEKNGIKVLNNKNVSLNINGKKVFVAGIEDLMTGQPNIYEALYGTGLGIGDDENGKRAPIIMLTHTPDMFPKVPKEVNLTLAGHTHGGQVRIPLMGTLIVPSEYGNKYANGLIEEKGKKLITTSGIGTSIIPIRFNCLPEIVVVEFVE